jgi:hypothetical protein
MSRPHKTRLMMLTALACGGVWTVSFAAAESLRGTHQSPASLCASYGPGFVPGEAPGQCIKVEERLRVEPHARRALSPLDAPSAFAPLAVQEGTLPAHLRLNGGFGANGLR